MYTSVHQSYTVSFLFRLQLAKILQNKTAVAGGFSCQRLQTCQQAGSSQPCSPCWRDNSETLATLEIPSQFDDNTPQFLLQCNNSQGQSEDLIESRLSDSNRIIIRCRKEPPGQYDTSMVLFIESNQETLKIWQHVSCLALVSGLSGFSPLPLTLGFICETDVIPTFIHLHGVQNTSKRGRVIGERGNNAHLGGRMVVTYEWCSLERTIFVIQYLCNRQ